MGWATSNVCALDKLLYLSRKPFVNSFFVALILLQAVDGLCVNILGGDGGDAPFLILEAAMVH